MPDVPAHSNRSWIVVLAVGLVVTAVAIGVAGRAEAAPEASSKNEPAPAACPPPAPATTSAPPRTVWMLREPAPAAMPVAAAPSPPTAPLRVHLRGLAPGVPWSGAVKVGWHCLDAVHGPRNQDFEQTRVVDGVAQFDLPLTITATGEGRITVLDRNYRATTWSWNGAAPHDVLLDVFRKCRIVGTIRGEAGETPVCEVLALALHDGQPTDEIVAQTDTRYDLNFELSVPPETPVAVLAVPTDAGRRLGMRLGPPGLHGDLLPVSRIVRAPFLSDTDLGTLVLPRAETRKGRVVCADGTLVAGMAVSVEPDVVRSLAYVNGYDDDDGTGVGWSREGGLMPRAVTHTDAKGEFSLPTVPGAEVVVQVGGRQPSLFGACNLATVDVQLRLRTRERVLEVQLPAPRLVRVVHGNRPVPHARIEFRGGTTPPAGDVWRHTGADGEMRWIGEQTAIRASTAERRSAWVSVGATESPVVLDLTESLGVVEVDLGGVRLRNACLTWFEDGERHAEPLAGRFRCGLPFGMHQVRITGAWDDAPWLSPIEATVNVTGAHQVLKLAARIGGTLRLFVRGDDGRHLAGACRLEDERGTELRPVFHATNRFDTVLAAGQPGQLLVQGANECAQPLPPGRYWLTVDVDGHSFARQPVTITAYERTDVHLRRP